MKNTHMPDVVHDVAVIGGGPAGMMAAVRAGMLGASAVLVEKNKRPGTKLLMTGGGRCNLTNTNLSPGALAQIMGKTGRFLYPALSAFSVSEVMRFFEERGVGLKVEDGGRVFPKSDRARDVLDALTQSMSLYGVKFFTGCAVTGLIREDGIITAVKTTAGVIRAKSFVVCTGGRSYPATGSTGDGYGWMAKLGHTVVPPAPALVPVKVKDAWVRDAEGASLRGVVVSAHQDGKKKVSVPGDCVVTRDGLSGPAVLDISGTVGELMNTGSVTLSLDLMPDIPAERMDAELIRMFEESPNRQVKGLAERLVVPKLAPVVIKLAGLEPTMRLNRVPRPERLKLGKLFKVLSVEVSGLHGFERAMVTSGGVSLKEVEQKSMRSKLAGNLYIAGELLDITGPTGGYNLQICWSTGYAAGEAAANQTGYIRQTKPARTL